MNESEYYARLRALTQLLNELRAQLIALNQRVVMAEQSLQQRWNSAGS